MKYIRPADQFAGSALTVFVIEQFFAAGILISVGGVVLELLPWRMSYMVEDDSRGKTCLKTRE